MPKKKGAGEAEGSPPAKVAKFTPKVMAPVSDAAALPCNNFPEWLEKHKKDLVPPVCNKLMYAEQLKVMFIGGSSANERTDYHLEDGEELFYQIKGDMVVKVMEKGKFKDVHIKEGEMWLLPPRVPHSPQRFPDTIGLVIERERKADETDGLRWYVPGTTDVLYETFFHCYDLGSQLGPAIRAFQASEANKTKVPNLEDGTVLDDPPLKIDDKITLSDAVPLAKWLEKEAEALDKGPRDMFKGADFKVTFFKNGSHKLEEKSETYIHQMEGSSELTIGDAPARKLNKGDMLVVPPGNFTLANDDDALQMMLTWPTC